MWEVVDSKSARRASVKNKETKKTDWFHSQGTCPDKTLDKNVCTNLKLWICRSVQIHNLKHSDVCFRFTLMLFCAWSTTTRLISNRFMYNPVSTGLCQVCSKPVSLSWSGYYESHDRDGEITAGFTHMGCGESDNLTCKDCSKTACLQG